MVLDHCQAINWSGNPRGYILKNTSFILSRRLYNIAMFIKCFLNVHCSQDWSTNDPDKWLSNMSSRTDPSNLSAIPHKDNLLTCDHTRIHCIVGHVWRDSVSHLSGNALDWTSWVLDTSPHHRISTWYKGIHLDKNQCVSHTIHSVPPLNLWEWNIHCIHHRIRNSAVLLIGIIFNLQNMSELVIQTKWCHWLPPEDLLDKRSHVWKVFTVLEGWKRSFQYFIYLCLRFLLDLWVPDHS